MNLKGRSFLKLLDFTPAEITYLLDLAAERTSHCCLKRIPPVPAAPLRWRDTIWVWG